jgi:hypothetical protein
LWTRPATKPKSGKDVPPATEGETSAPIRILEKAKIKPVETQPEVQASDISWAYCWPTFLATASPVFPTPTGPVHWAKDLARELIQRQRADGSWVNPLVPQREDDPLVATSMAVLALNACRTSLGEVELQPFLVRPEN